MAEYATFTGGVAHHTCMGVCMCVVWACCAACYAACVLCEHVSGVCGVGHFYEWSSATPAYEWRSVTPARAVMIIMDGNGAGSGSHV